MVYGSLIPSRILKTIAIKAGDDTKSAAAAATVNAMKKLAQKAEAKIPDVTVSSQAPQTKTPWLLYAVLGGIGLAAFKALSD